MQQWQANILCGEYVLRKEWDNLIDKVDAKVHENLGIPIERYLGFCHTFWQERKEVFKELYGIDWKTPAEMNPGAMFD